MLVTKIPKRKFKKTLNTIYVLSIIFLITFGILLLFYVSLSLKKNIIKSPISHLFNKNQSTISFNPGGLKTLLEKQNIDVSDITSSSDSSTLVVLKDGGNIMFSDKKSLSDQIASLQLIMRQLTIEGRRFKRIDFRFDNPVIVF